MPTPQVSIYYLCFSSIIFLPLLLFLFFKFRNRLVKAFFLLCTLVCLFTIWAFFIERHWLRITEINLDKGWDARIVVIADQHLGIYKDHRFMDRVIDKINALEGIDAVLIAGDFTYRPKDLAAEQANLSRLRFPVYAVLGNHDVLPSGPLSQEEALRPILARAGVELIDNRTVNAANGLVISGLGSHWANNDDTTILRFLDHQAQNLILAHNPDTTLMDYPPVDLSNAVTITGHTHCGQIRLPWLYERVIPTWGHFPDQGPYDLKERGTLVITCGLGEIGLPLRLFNRPEIMLLLL